MLKLIGITKSYITGDFSQVALDRVCLEFGAHEFVAILGESGSGKTTLLNIIGGLDRNFSGEMIVSGRSAATFRGADWDAYRNNSIGFVFQNYNLIDHLTVLDNIELAMTLSGLPRRKRRQKALALLEQVGLAAHAKKKPGQLSGGQQQRVAIARALANDPDILLADEPTGALDTETSIQILDLMQKIAKDKLVILVTHNAALARRYATRIIELKDGRVQSDTGGQAAPAPQKAPFSLKKTAMGYATALKLSFTNLLTKKGRTFLTSLAFSVGIAGIALILSLSHGFSLKIRDFEADAMSGYPIMISKQSLNVNEAALKDMLAQDDFPDEPQVYPHDNTSAELLHTNRLTEAYVDYVEKLDRSLVSGIAFTRTLGLNILSKAGDKIHTISAISTAMTELPQNPDGAISPIITENYDLLAGAYPTRKEDLLLVIDQKNRVDLNLVRALGLEAQSALDFNAFVGIELRLIYNNDYYQQKDDFYAIRRDLDQAYESENALKLNICGILRLKKDSPADILAPGLAYTYAMAEHVIDNAKNSDIVKALESVDYNVLTGERLDLSTEEGRLAKAAQIGYFGGTRVPLAIMIYPGDFDAKEAIRAYLDAWNENRPEEEKIFYIDSAALITDLASSIVKAITLVLVAFSSVSLLVAMLMIGVIIYTSVLERTREIGLLRALGARKKDISRVFNAEICIVGLLSGLLGLSGAWLMTLPVNALIKALSDLPSVAKLHPGHAAALLLVSLTLTYLGGLIPARLAANKDPAAALRAV